MAEKHLTDGTTALAAQPRVIKIEAAEKPQNERPIGKCICELNGMNTPCGGIYYLI